MINFNFNTVAAHVILGLETISPAMRDCHQKIPCDFHAVLASTRTGDRVDVKAVVDLTFHAMQITQHIFWATVFTTCSTYLAVKYTPIFRPIFKIMTLASAVFTFEFFMIYTQMYKEYAYFDMRSKESVTELAWQDYMQRLDELSRNILASTFFVSGRRFLAEDITTGVQTVMKTAKAKGAELNVNDVKNALPGLSVWFHVGEEA